MPTSYEPVEDAVPVPPWSIATLSERDLSLRVPINFVTVPGVSLRHACFGHDIFDSDAAVTCFSNLLATGFRRFEWDLFWDTTRRVWSFCPIQIPQSAPGGTTSPTRVQFNSTTVTVSNAVISQRAPGPSNVNDHIDTKETPFSIPKRQQISTSIATEASDSGSTSFLDPTLAGSVTALASSTSVPPSTSSPGSLIQNGPYSCSPSIDLPILVAVLARYFESTSNTLDAFLTYLTLNLHVAASSASKPASTLNSTTLPSSQEVISYLLGVNLTSYLYTPTALAHERSNVNSTWFGAPSDAQPLDAYFNLTQLKESSSSENGWPNEIYIEFDEQHRLLVEFGRIDPQLSSYNLSNDADTVFPPSYLKEEATNVILTASGNLTSGCIYNPSDLTTGGNNNSWATFALNQFTADREAEFTNQSVAEVANLTACGISPFLNTTLFNQTADQDISKYSDFIKSMTWSWAYGEPRNVSSEEPDYTRIRCAAMDRTLNGRWRVVDCTDKHYAACRIDDDPFTWRISSTRATYTTSNDICGDDQFFSVPVTPLENSHLFREMQADVEDDLLWVNFNSLDYGNCWVMGVNETCPYRERTTNDDSRKVIVPTVAAVIVFIITALTIFVKCAANRQTSRRRRRRGFDSNWEYEGVPS